MYCLIQFDSVCKTQTSSETPNQTHYLQLDKEILPKHRLIVFKVRNNLDIITSIQILKIIITMQTNIPMTCINKKFINNLGIKSKFG